MAKESWDGDLKCIELAQELINKWNKVHRVNKKYTLIKPILGRKTNDNWEAIKSVSNYNYNSNTDFNYTYTNDHDKDFEEKVVETVIEEDDNQDFKESVITNDTADPDTNEKHNVNVVVKTNINVNVSHNNDNDNDNDNDKDNDGIANSTNSCSDLSEFAMEYMDDPQFNGVADDDWYECYIDKDEIERFNDNNNYNDNFGNNVNINSDGSYSYVNDVNSYYFEKILEFFSQTMNEIAQNQVKSSKNDQRIIMDEVVIVEPYLNGKFTKWNSNSGWKNKEDDSEYSSVQAFCHWTYHESKGKYLFCDAQGIRKFDEYVLTDPCIVSNTINGGVYGVGDIGRQFLLNWFCDHDCRKNKFCQSDWLRPTQAELDAVPPIVQINRQKASACNSNTLGYGSVVIGSEIILDPKKIRLNTFIDGIDYKDSKYNIVYNNEFVIKIGKVVDVNGALDDEDENEDKEEEDGEENNGGVSKRKGCKTLVMILTNQNRICLVDPSTIPVAGIDNIDNIDNNDNNGNNDDGDKTEDIFFEEIMRTKVKKIMIKDECTFELIVKKRKKTDIGKYTLKCLPCDENIDCNLSNDSDDQGENNCKNNENKGSTPLAIEWKKRIDTAFELTKVKNDSDLQNSKLAIISESS